MKSLIKKVSTMVLFGLVVSSPVFAGKNHTASMQEKPVYENINILPTGGSYKVYGQSTEKVHGGVPARKYLFEGKNGYSLCVNCDNYEYVAETTNDKFASVHQSTDFANATTWDVGEDKIS
jgi:hypothetical protein